jgi:putative ABC transport system substrate-binding protein
MRRRDFFGLAIASTAFVWSGPISAQQRGKVPIIAFLGGATPQMWGPWTGAYVDRLKALGWIDGQNAKLEFRWAEGRPELYIQFAQEFATLNPNVIFAAGAALSAVMKATSNVPIVFFANEPRGTGMVKSLARPSGNMTGITLQNLDIAAKRFQLLREAVPNIRRLAIMADATYDATLLEMNTVQEFARKFEIDSIPFKIRRTEDIEAAFARLKTEQADALYVVINELLNANRLLIVTSAQAANLPAIYGTRLGPIRRTHLLWTQLSFTFRTFG